MALCLDKFLYGIEITKNRSWVTFTLVESSRVFKLATKYRLHYLTTVNLISALIYCATFTNLALYFIYDINR